MENQSEWTTPFREELCGAGFFGLWGMLLIGLVFIWGAVRLFTEQTPAKIFPTRIFLLVFLY